MAVNEDMDYPRLTPPDDRYPSAGSLFRTPHDLTGEQFDLLAAARAEDSLSEEGRSDFDIIISSAPGRLEYADSFRQLRLHPMDERMEGLDSLIKTPQAVIILRRTLFTTLAAAAVVLAYFTLRPFAGQQTGIIKPEALPELTIVAEKGISPVVKPALKQKPIAAQPLTVSETTRKSESDVVLQATDDKITLMTTALQPAIPILASLTRSEELCPVNFREIPVAATYRIEENWIVKGIASLSGAAGKGNKPSGSYIIADACIKALNRVLGSEMELKRVISDTGNPVSVNFSSSLLSFSAPVKKTSP